MCRSNGAEAPSRSRAFAQQHGQRVARRRHLVLVRRNRRLVLSQLGLDGGHVRRCGAARRIGLSDHVQVGLVVGDDVAEGVDVDGGVTDGEVLDHHLAGQRQIGGVQFAGLLVRVGLQRFARAAHAPEQVEVVADRAADRVEVELRIGREEKANGFRRGEARRAEVGALARIAAVGVHEQEAGADPYGLARGREAGAGGLERPVVGDRLAHQGVEVRHLEQRPPLGDHLVADRRLDRARIGDVGGLGVGVGRGGRRRGMEVRADRGAAGQQRGGADHRSQGAQARLDHFGGSEPNRRR